MSSVTSFENALERDYTLFLEEDDSFLIISRDKERTERFYVSPFLLSYVSPVFRQLLSPSQGEKGDNTIVGNRSLELKQSPIVVEHFLRHIDPTLPTPELNHETVVGVLELAELYKVKSIIRWFEEVSVLGCVDVRGVVTRDAFVQKHPLLVLGLSCRLQLHNCVQMAMHELVICHSDKYKEDTAGISLDHRLVTHCRRLRDDLSNVYSALVYQLASHELSNKGNIKDSEQVTCMRCTVARAQWIHGLMSVTINHPRWSEFLVAYANTGECSACKISWANHMSRTLSRWKGTLAARQVVEPSLPEVPAWVIESWAMY
ncbi:hypothetical protein CPB86DRAFT_731481 [Serendipita vermifera]|nr:hypothetical protein CPB86DRAFT_731481 [Serendipita vermifera]